MEIESLQMCLVKRKLSWIIVYPKPNVWCSYRKKNTQRYTEERSPFKSGSRKKKSGSRWQEEWGGGIRREFEIEYTQLYLKWITSKDLPYSTGNSAQYYVAAWMGGGWRENGYMCIVWLRPFFVHLKLSEQCLLFFFSPKCGVFTRDHNAFPYTSIYRKQMIHQSTMLLISCILIENKMFKYKKNKYSETRDE